MKRLRGATAVGTLLIGAGLLVSAQPAFASIGTTYYVDNSTGCSDSSAGTSAASPWCDFHNLNVGAVVFGAGDALYLKRGDSWNVDNSSDNHPNFAATASSGAPSTIGAYGSGAPPILTGNRTNAAGSAMDIVNPSNLDVSSLHLTNVASGVNFHLNSAGLTALSVHDLIVDHSNFTVGSSHAIQFTTSLASTSTPLLTASSVTHNTITDTDGGIGIYGYNWWTFPSNVFDNIRIIGNTITNAASPSLDIVNTSDSLFVDNVFTNISTSGAPQGTTATFVFKASNNLIANNVFNGVPNTSSHDQTALDFEGYDTDNQFRDNYVTATAGSALELLQLHADSYRGSDDYNTNQIMSANSFINVGASNGAPAAGVFALSYDSTSHLITGSLADSLYSSPSLVVPGTDGSGAQYSFTGSNNVPVAPTQTYGAAIGFSSTAASTGSVPCAAGSACWSYQIDTGGSYSSVGSYQASSASWGGPTFYLSAFDTLPSPVAAEWVTRSWTAPSAGSLSIRGRALMATIGGDGVRIRITRNGAVVWPSSGGYSSISGSDQSGIDSVIDGLAVSAGDVIRFEVNDGGGSSNTADVVSWAPVVAYSNQPVGQWSTNEGSGLTAHDTSGSGNNATLTGSTSPSWTTGPTSGSGAVQLSSSQSQYLNVPASSLLSGTPQLTASVWVNMTSLPTLGAYVEPLGNDASTGGAYRFIINHDGTGHFVVATTNNGWYSSGTTAQWSLQLSPGSWYHLVGTYDGSTVRVYLDGIQAGIGSAPISGPIVPTTNPLTFGFGYGSGVTTFNGALSQPRIYATAESPTQVEKLYDAQSNVVSSWLTNEGGGLSLSDASGGSHTLTLQNGASWSSGFLGGSVSFNGSNQYATGADPGDLSGMSQLSVSTWLNLSSVPSGSDCVEPVGKENSVESYRLLVCGSNQAFFVVATTNNAWYSSGTYALSTAPVSSGTWHHFVGVYDGSYVKLYMDGVLEGTGSSPVSGSIVSGTAPLTMAQPTGSGVSYLSGSESTVRLYKRAISSQEVSDLHSLY